MPALFEEGFFVRKPAWHGLGVVLSDFPGREEAFDLAGHDFEVVEYGNGDVLEPLSTEEWDILKFDRNANVVRHNGQWHRFGARDQEKGMRIKQMRDGSPGPLHGNKLKVVSTTYTPVQNSVPWDILEVLLEGKYDGKSLNYETGGTLDGGAECFVTAWLDLPFQIKGDDSEIYPYVYATWRHDGLGALNVGGGDVRIVCANTVNLAKAQGERSGHLYTFKHTKNVMARIEDAKLAIFHGIVGAHSEFQELAEELGSIELDADQVSEFFMRLIPDTPESLTSERVRNNINEARSLVRSALYSRTVPEAHKATGWGLYNAGVEFFDHLRKPGTATAEMSSGTDWRDAQGKVPTSYVRRTMYAPDKFKSDHLIPLIKEVAGVAA